MNSQRKNKKILQKGSLIAEFIIAVAVLIVIAGLGAELSYVSMQGSENSQSRDAALRLAEEALEAMRAIMYGNDGQSQGWNRAYKPPDGAGNPSSSKGAANPYYPIVSTTTDQWVLFSGIESVSLESGEYTRKVIIENVSRDANNAIESPYNPGNDDPGTQKVTVTVSRSKMPDTILTYYFTRFLNDASPQSDWSGAQDCGPVSATGSPATYCSHTCVDRSSGSIKLVTSC